MLTIVQLYQYAESLFPILGWITRYSKLICAPLRRITDILTDLGWLSGDVVAGLTVGIVVVPQSMSYALVRIQSCHLLVGFTSPTCDCPSDCHSSCGIRSLLRLRRCSDLLCTYVSTYVPAVVLMMHVTLIALRHLQGCFYRSCCRHVAYGLANH